MEFLGPDRRARRRRADQFPTSAPLRRLADENETASGPLAVLREYDRTHDINLVDTLRAWLDTFGDIPAAASLVHIHVNTFRYRLKKLAGIAGIDLDDPETRFSLMLQLRLFYPTAL
ncbi:helix-turn-helix domain-containing protein [Rhodococcus erythropolis]|uniref:PucR family transcriptional regulator n=1 Tax=Rhodococcus erythropolis TaxID=1833 RepID=UPI00338E0F20